MVNNLQTNVSIKFSSLKTDRSLGGTFLGSFMSILIIDSDRNECGEQETLLKKAGYSYISSVQTMAAALNVLGIESTAALAANASTGFDLVIVALSTIEECADVCRKIKDSFQYQDIPIIVMTSAATSEALPFVVAYGAYDFIRKPYSELEYLARVRSAIKLKHEMDRRKAREKELIEATRQLADLNSMLVKLSLIDSMTGVANRRSFDRILDKEWRRAIRNGLPISVIMIDVDFFKSYNDHYGHQEGDECLKLVARILKDTLRRPGDAICRYGGEEFVIILPDTPSEGAGQVGESLRAAVFSAGIPHHHSKIADRISVSVGTSTMIATSRFDPKDLVESADKALYAAKASGRNKVIVSDVSGNSKAA